MIPIPMLMARKSLYAGSQISVMATIKAAVISAAVPRIGTVMATFAALAEQRFWRAFLYAACWF
jgi:hypothetical protein